MFKLPPLVLGTSAIWRDDQLSRVGQLYVQTESTSDVLDGSKNLKDVTKERGPIFITSLSDGVSNKRCINLNNRIGKRFSAFHPRWSIPHIAKAYYNKRIAYNMVACGLQRL